MKQTQTVMALAASISLSQGATIVYSVDNILTEYTPESTAPWISVTMVDITNRATDPSATMDYVGITIESSLDQPQEYVSVINIALDEKFADLETGLGSVDVGGFQAPTATVGNNMFQGGVAGTVGSTFDLQLEFSKSGSNGGAERFNWSDVYTIVVGFDGADIMTAETLGLIITGDPDPFTVAHIQGIGDGGELSAWTTSIPEPSTILLSALSTLGLIARRKRVK